VVSFTARHLYPLGKNHRYPLDRRLGGPQSRSGQGAEEKNSQLPPGIELRSSDRPAHSPVAMPTELSWLPSDIWTLIKINERIYKFNIYKVRKFVPIFYWDDLE
jgi:hypothetical protein